MIRLRVLVIVLFCSGVYLNAQEHTNILWYNTEAKNWNEALPIGNGRIGGMVFGRVAHEKIQLNEETVWAGEPGNNIPENAYPTIEKLRTLLFEGKNEKAQELAKKVFPKDTPTNLNYGMPYQTVGNLNLIFENHNSISSYKRTLDLNKAIATVEYESGGVKYQREYFVSYPDQLMVIRLTADKPKSISVDISFDTPQKKQEVSVENNTLQLKGVSGNMDNKKGSVEFTTILYPELKAGKLIEKEDQLSVVKADEVVLYLSIGTNFKSYNDLTNSADTIAKRFVNVGKKSKYQTIKASHLKDYQRLYNRVSLQLVEDKFSDLPTDKRLENFSKNNDLGLVSTYFQYGRYLLISSSRPGGQPANLQGIWNYQLNPPWDSKYTVNINTEMNYWPSEATNLSELGEPLFQMLKELSVTGKESAQKMYKANGWNMHHNTDIWRVTGIIDGGFYGMWPMGGAWLTQHLWQHYLFTGDKDFLKEYYPVLKSCAEFYKDVLIEEPEHSWLVVAPSMSPENKYQNGVGITYGTTMDNQLVFDVFSNAVSAAKILEIDNEFTDTLQILKEKLPPMQIGKHNQLQEWIKDWDDPGDKHRHVSHLYGLCPSAQISPFKNPELFKAAEQSLEYRGDISTGWSMGWKVNLWARLLNGNRAYKLIKSQLTLVDNDSKSGGTYPNLLDAHPPFQIDGNFGCTAGIAEMLIQSHDDALHLLPALPDGWSNGSVKGLKARGGFEVALDWGDNHLLSIQVKSNLGGNLRLRTTETLVDSKGKELIMAKGENPNQYYNVPTIKSPIVSSKAKKNTLKLPEYKLYDVETEAAKEYVFKVQLKK
ncbi:glycoside hydrolase family 95 protein [Galbibacter sp. EGI 63066]|uniref:glycoside hydrolase family 95 protein n=1 Tax=Galbibacter sp. EGI 63066 TaxID=2993559 RepID=UPI002248A13C|nr:glycoside hydrolase family 95 protein [Galbibacter sp. EGI 63066]MCX2680005.1 glycoside hydrolase family 95 protein [Galbibacter sp. EGI 63066]